MDDWSGGLILSGGHINIGKLYLYPIEWVWTDGKPIMLSSENGGDIHFYQKRW